MLIGNELILSGLAAVAAGMINAVAGGGTLVSFPALIGLGIPAVTANITNTVALCPGYLGGALAQRKDLDGQRSGWYSCSRRVSPVGFLGASCCSL